MNLLPGDIFLTNQGGFMSKAIVKVNQFWSLDGEAKYSHSGIIIGYGGETFESRWKIGRYNMSDFDGIPTLVARNRLMTADRFERGAEQVMCYEGGTYPWWRIPLHLIPPIARHNSTGRYLVCSEIVSKFLFYADLLGGDQYKGWTPDNLNDMVVHWKAWEIISERK